MNICFYPLGHICLGIAGSCGNSRCKFFEEPPKGLPQQLYHFHSHQQGLRVPWKVLSRWGKRQNCALKTIRGTSFCERTGVLLGLVGVTCPLKHSSGNTRWERLGKAAGGLWS